MADDINIEVVYALPRNAHTVILSVPLGTTIRSAVEHSGLMEKHPEIDLDHNKVGIFGQLKNLDDRLKSGDRVEIYRPLKVDPKEARRRRALKRQ